MFSVTGKTNLSALRFQQQFLLLRQSALQHQQQQQQTAQASTPPAQPQAPPQPQTALPPQTAQVPVTQKVVLPAGIEQLRPTVALQQRFQTATSTSGGVRTVPATGRSLQTEEVLALLKQQSLRMASQSAYKAGPATQFHPRESTATHLPLPAEGVGQVSKQPSSGSTAPEGVKLAQGPAPAAGEGEQLKVERVDQGKVQPKAQLEQTQPTEQSSAKETT